jgi:hypothetical protein
MIATGGQAVLGQNNSMVLVWKTGGMLVDYSRYGMIKPYAWPVQEVLTSDHLLFLKPTYGNTSTYSSSLYGLPGADIQANFICMKPGISNSSLKKTYAVRMYFETGNSTQYHFCGPQLPAFKTMPIPGIYIIQYNTV